MMSQEQQGQDSVLSQPGEDSQGSSLGGVGLDPGDGTYHMSKDDPRASGNGTYEQGCMNCGQVAPIAAGTAEEGYECGNCSGDGGEDGWKSVG